MSNSSDHPTPSPGPKKRVVIKVIGVGGAGGNIVEQMVNERIAEISYAVVNTDVQALNRSGLSEKRLLGNERLHGLGAGGDPELGRQAAIEDIEMLQAMCRGVDIVFIMAGMGGGTGTGAAPVLAQAAREAGALSLAVVTLPFEFEGGRRQAQALAGLSQLKEMADAVICLPNDKLIELLRDHATVLEAFRTTNELLAQGVRGIWRMLAHPGLVNIDLADLRTVTMGKHTECTLATVDARGKNRGQQVLDKLMAHPLLEKGQALREAEAVMISVVGGSDLVMDELQQLVSQIGLQSGNAYLLFGAAVDHALAGRVLVTVIASRHMAREVIALPVPKVTSAAPPPPAALPVAPVNLNPAPEGEAPVDRMTAPVELTEDNQAPASAGTASARFTPPAAPLTEAKRAQLLEQRKPASGRRAGAKGVAEKNQEELQLDILPRGRFDKSEPTIHGGENLDIPTYIRRGAVMN